MSPHTTATRHFEECLEAVVTKVPQDGSSVVSVWCSGLVGPEVMSLDAHVPHYAASTMKLPVLRAAYQLHETGALDLEAEVPVVNAFRSAVDAPAYALAQDDDQDDATWGRVGGTAPLRWLAERMTVVSGNLAANLVLAATGAAAVADELARAGCSPATTLPCGIGDLAARAAGVRNHVTAADLGLLVRSVTPEVEEVLSRQQVLDKIPAGLPHGTYVAGKSGWVEGVAHDVALVRPSDAPPYALAVCTTTSLAGSDASALIADVSRLVWEAWTA